jgi:O-antigen ligase
MFFSILEISKNNKKKKIDEISTILIILSVYIIVSLPFVKWPGSVLRFGIEGFLKSVLLYFYTFCLVTSGKRLKLFIFIFVLCQCIRFIEPAYLHLTTDYWGSSATSSVGYSTHYLNRLSGAPNDIINPNQLSWIINCTIPFFYFMGWKSNKKKLKIVTLGLTPILLYTLILTGSRSGIICLIVNLISIVKIERNQIKDVIIAIIIILPLFFFAINLLSQDLENRYKSVYDAEAVGRDTVTGRLNHLKKVALNMSTSVVFGHGLGTSKETNYNIVGAKARRTHNLYLEIIQEIGIIGLIIFLLYIYTITIKLKNAKSYLNKQVNSKWLINVISALQVWIVMNLVYALSCFGLSSWEWYVIGGISACCVKLVNELISKDINLSNVGLKQIDNRSNCQI